ncbi:ankyrin repeat and MYND domain-containing protein 1 [Gadus morhua]|uniref:ankyrin repeat and MYND domain-containing protein 1 n=1 Tax=Gadus morhua TaxID=8049 RepID=UPI0011B51980|nr:ankyrin repeat and MYND domain-containing protein 1 [Gadus morhua]
MLSQCGGGEPLDQGRPWLTKWTSPMWGDMRQGHGVQEWPDGSRYEGEYLNGLRHGPGRFTWRNGECYEGAFHRDYRHGEGVYSWPSGHKFTGKFYLNKKDGFGRKEFPDGSSFQGLYHAHQKFGPGVLTHPDGRQDVGLWRGEHLVRLCTSLEGGFSLSSFPEYAAYMGPPPAAAIDPLATPFLLSTATKPVSKDPSDTPVADRLSEESLARPPGLEYYSADGDHLPLPPSFQGELDRSFFGALWEPDTEPAPAATLPWQLRMQAHVRRHRLETVRVGWDVRAVLSLSRSPFGPKGPLELSSELLIQKAGEGDRHEVNRILRTRRVSPDVSDARGHTALTAATVNCHDAVIHLLLDTGADIDHLNCEGMNALAVCHVLYYPFQSLHTTLAEKAIPPTLSTAEPEATLPPPPVDSPPRPPSPPRADPEINEQHGDSDSSTPEDSQQGSLPESEGGEEVPGQLRSLQVLDGHIPLGSVVWRGGGARATRGVALAAGVKRFLDEADRPVFNSAQSLESFFIPVTEDGMQHTAEALSRIGVPPRTHSHETLRRMAAMKTEHRARWSTLSLLLQRGSDPNASRLPMPVLFLAIKAAHVEAVRALLQRGAQTDRPLPAEWKGLYPLHVAAGLSGPEGPSITELLLHAMADADAQALDQEDVYHLDKTRTETQTALGNKTLAPPSWGPDPEDGFPGAPPEGGRTALHLACQRDTDHSNASEVVSLLLSRRARTHLLWSGHSALSLAIASGNDMAVELLLKGGADPNLPLGRGVGSALCALTNIDYDSTGHPHDRAKMLDMLDKAGADIRMPVLVGEGQKRAFGTAVDYAHYTFNQDQRIAHTSYHALSQRERAVHEARGQLLRLMAAMLRQTAGRGGAGERTPPAGANNKEKFVYKGGGANTPQGRGPRATVAKETNRPESPVSDRETENGGPADRAESKASWQSRTRADGRERRTRTPLGSCYQCGRSAFVTLTPCSRCHQVLYCSGSCKLKAWEQRHRGECIRLPVSPSSPPQRERVKASRTPGPLKVSEKVADRPLKRPEKVPEVHIDPSENYSFI